MRIAILDLGTNTFNLLIKDSNNDEVVFNGKIPVKLGEGGISKGFIAEKAFERGLDAMQNHVNTINQYKATKILALATSAIRDAQNGPEFVQKVFQQTGIEIKTINGLLEAELIAEGVAHALQMPALPSLIIDIGGGSTEFIVCENGTVKWMNSYPLGVSRLLELFRPSDPISTEEVLSLNEHFGTLLSDLDTAMQKWPSPVLIGSSGSFDTLADICMLKADSQAVPLNTPSYLFDLATYRLVEREILKSTFEERLLIPGMLAMRADMIVLSCILIRYVLERYSIKSMWLSKYALKEGAYFRLKSKGNV